MKFGPKQENVDTSASEAAEIAAAAKRRRNFLREDRTIVLCRLDSRLLETPTTFHALAGAGRSARLDDRSMDVI